MSATSEKKPVRYGMVLLIRPECLEEYKRYHAAVWPEVLATIERSRIRNYSIFHKDHVLYSYFEYWGDDYEADMAKMAADPATQRWWALMEPMQEPLPTRATGEWWARMEPLPTRAPGEWWARMEEVFHND